MSELNPQRGTFDLKKCAEWYESFMNRQSNKLLSLWQDKQQLNRIAQVSAFALAVNGLSMYGLWHLSNKAFREANTTCEAGIVLNLPSLRGKHGEVFGAGVAIAPSRIIRRSFLDRILGPLSHAYSTPQSHAIGISNTYVGREIGFALVLTAGGADSYIPRPTKTVNTEVSCFPANRVRPT